MNYYFQIHHSSPAYAGSPGCGAVEECPAGVLQSRAVAKAAMARRRLGEGGPASVGYAEEKREATAVKLWAPPGI